MKKYIVIIITLGVLLVIASGCRSTPNLQDEYGKFEMRQSEFFTAVSEGDADATAELFSESAVLHIANRPPIEGRDAIQQFYGNMFQFLSASTVTPQTITVSASGDMAYSYGRTVNEFLGPQGTMEYTGKYILVWEKVEDKWMIVLYGISSNQPDPAR